MRTHLVDGLMRAAEMAREMSEQLHATASREISRGNWDSAHVATMVAQAYIGFASRLESEAEQVDTGIYAIPVDGEFATG